MSVSSLPLRQDTRDNQPPKEEIFVWISGYGGVGPLAVGSLFGGL